MTNLKALANLARTRHTFQIIGIVTIFSIASHGVSSHTFYAISSSFFLSVAVFFLDDAHDIASDRIAHPQRPIPKGVFSIRQIYLAGVVMLSIGIVLASLLLFYQFAIFIVVTSIAVAVIFVNLQSVVRAFLTAFLIGALFPFSAFCDLKTLFFGLIVAFPHVGGSIAKDFLHSLGDQAQGLAPPQEWTRCVAGISFFLSSAILWLPFAMNFVTWFYLPPIVLTFITCVILGISVSKGNYQRVYTFGPVGMLSALVAFLVGVI